MYETWHAKMDTTWTVVPEDLNALALEIMNCMAEVTGLTQAFLATYSRHRQPGHGNTSRKATNDPRQLTASSHRQPTTKKIKLKAICHKLPAILA